MLFFIALVIFILYCLNDSNKLYARRRNYHAEHPPHWKQEEYMLCCEAFHDNIVANDLQTIEEMVDQMRDALIDGRRALLHKGFLPLSCDHLTPASDQERRQMEHDLSLPNWDVILPLCWPPSIDRVKDLTANGESLDFSIYLAKPLGIRFKRKYDKNFLGGRMVDDDDDIERHWAIFKAGYFQRIIDAEDQYQEEVQNGTWSLDYDELIDQAIKTMNHDRREINRREKIRERLSPYERDEYTQLAYDDFAGLLRYLQSKEGKYG